VSATKSPYTLHLDTSVPAAKLRASLAEFQPWTALIEFSNGVKTSDCETHDAVFTEHTLYKISRTQDYIPFVDIKDGRALDIGCNAGYNSIYLGKTFGFNMVGVDLDPRLIGAAQYLSKLAGVEAEFYVGHAESFVRKETFDVVLHFGTLYHLYNPLRSLQLSFLSLKPNGYLALETQCYDDPADENLCYFIHGLNNDATNYFALSTHVVVKSLELLGFVSIQECVRHPTSLSDRPNMYRVLLVARKPADAVDPSRNRNWPRWAEIDMPAMGTTTRKGRIAAGRRS